MQNKTLGKNGPAIPLGVGFGCMGMSDFYGSRANDEAESVAVLEAALDAGIGFLNTGDFYGLGHNELLLRRALAERSRQPLLSVKFGAMRGPGGEFVGFDGRPQAVKSFAAYSLVRLGRDVIDLYQPARVDPTVPIEDTVGAIKELIDAGHVRYLGLSEASPEQLRRAHAVHPVSALEVEYSLGTRIIERELLQTARELGVAVVAYGVLSRGLLSGRVTQLAAGDFRAHIPRFSGENFSENKKRVALLEDMAREKSCTPAQLAISWVLHQGDNVIPLLATTNRRRLEENLAALDIRLDKEDLRRLDELFPEGAIQGDRYPEAQMAMVVR